MVCFTWFHVIYSNRDVYGKTYKQKTRHPFLIHDLISSIESGPACPDYTNRPISIASLSYQRGRGTVAGCHRSPLGGYFGLMLWFISRGSKKRPPPALLCLVDLLDWKGRIFIGWEDFLCFSPKWCKLYFLKLIIIVSISIFWIINISFPLIGESFVPKW